MKPTLYKAIGDSGMTKDLPVIGTFIDMEHLKDSKGRICLVKGHLNYANDSEKFAYWKEVENRRNKD